MSWGTKLTLVFISFVGLMATLVYKSFNTHFDLVTKDYYGEELRYQEVIDGKANAEAMEEQIAVAQATSDVVISFPASLHQEEIKGEVWLYFPNNAKFDQRIPLQLQNGIQKIPVALLSSGNYEARVQWIYKGKPYYKIQQLVIQK
jgi:hypothetical protein